MVTQHRLKEVLDYNPETGVFTWRKTNNQINKGAIAGSPSSCGYIRFTVDGMRYAAHRLAWLYVYGEYPETDIDHVNRIRSDNRISNLRTASRAENCQNASKRKSNSSGVVGVCWNIGHKKWQARIMHNGKSIHLGYYEKIEDAASARLSAKRKYHAFHPEDNNEKTARL